MLLFFASFTKQIFDTDLPTGFFFDTILLFQKIMIFYTVQFDTYLFVNIIFFLVFLSTYFNEFFRLRTFT